MSSSVSWDAVCRLCLSSRAHLLPIFGGDDSDALADKIQQCVSVQVQQDDELPTRVCSKCRDNVTNWHLFKKICEKSQAKLQVLHKESAEADHSLKIKREPFTDENYDDSVIIDASYPNHVQNNAVAKMQPEGPPILASLGLAPRNEKFVESSKEDEEDEEDLEDGEGAELMKHVKEQTRYERGAEPEVSVTVMRPSGETLQARQNIQQLASKNCLVCGRAYRYSHNARRHELTAHYFDRYTNKINKNLKPKHQRLRPNPFNPKARLMPNPINPKMQFIPRFGPEKMLNIPIKSKLSHKNNLPFPLRIKALTDLQVQKKKEPQILKSLLTARAKAMARESDMINSGPESPETLISEPEIASFQVEAIITEPDAFDNEEDNDEDIGVDDSATHNTYDTVEMDSEQEIEISAKQDKELSNHSEKEAKDGEENEMDENEEPYDEEVLPGQECTSASKDSTHNTEAIIENGIGEHDEGDDEDADEDVENEGTMVDEHEYDEDMPPIAPIVEINEGPQANSFTSEVADEEEEEEAEINDTPDDQSLLEPSAELDPNDFRLEKAQRDFILKYRDIIEQINTKKCKCCDKLYPRRKAVIQHLQKMGHKVPKHTCYNCVTTFGHIGALLSHMRTNVCTNLWRVIYTDESIMNEKIVEEEVKEPLLSATLNKVQYKDILNARSYACKLCPAKFQLKQFIMKHVLDVHEDGQSRVPLACVHCGYRFKENRLWKKHIRNGECTVNIACDLCPEKFLSIIDFNDHAVAVHAGSFDSSDGLGKQVDSRPTDCPICNKTHSNYHNLVKHLKAIHNEEKPHFCTHCDAKFEGIADLNHHIYMEHSDGSRPQEPDMTIVKEEAEEYHYSCTECNSIFETVDAWTDHQVAEHNQVAHHCDQCEKKFLRPSELAEHKNTHLRVKYYSCSLCPNTYSTPQKLTDHVQQDHPVAAAALAANPENQFYCELCIRGFKSRQAYSNHMRIHSKVPTTNRKPGEPRPSQLPKQRPSGQFPAFTSHFNIPNAPYSCDICGKGFMHKKNIWKHKKVLHADLLGLTVKPESEENTMQASTEGEEDYQMDESGSGLSIPQFNSFNFTNYTPQTQAIKADGQLFSCEICSKKFPLKTSLFKHKRAKHGIINPSAVSNGQEVTQPSNGESNNSRSSCTICKISFTDKKSYYRHRKNVHKSTVQMCKICGKPLNSTLELYEHLKAAHARELLGYNANAPKMQEQSLEYGYDGEDGGDYQARYPCDTCGKQFVGMLALQNHQCLQDTTQPSSYDCEICHKSYSSISALKSHRGWHLRSPDGKAAANNSGLWMPHHKITNKHSKHEILEPSVTKVQSIQPALNATKRRLPPEVEVTVVNPNKKTRSNDSVSEAEVLSHLAQRSAQAAEPDERYCSLCDKEFTKKAAYQRHMDEVHRPNSIFCPVCDKSFTRKSTLLIHMRKHYDGEDAADGEPIAGPSDSPMEIHACDLCGAQYRSDRALRAHKAQHHGEPDESEEEEEEEEEETPTPPGEFTCGQCGDGVATPRDLLAHRTMHATPTKFFCHICKVYFSRALDLSSHTRLRHADNDKVFFPCAMCDRFYMNKKSLQRHIETSH